jgi:preprotein translocase subunit YajC
MKFSKLIAASLLAAASVPAAVSAQADAPKVEITVGAMVYGPQGAEVGKVTELGDGYVVIDTGANLATLPANAVGKDAQARLIISMTKDQLDAAIAQAKQEAEAKLAVALVPGAAVATSDGVAVGTVKEINAEGTVIVDRDAGAIGFPKNQFTTDANGGLALLFSDEQLKAALGGG